MITSASRSRSIATWASYMASRKPISRWISTTAKAIPVAETNRRPRLWTRFNQARGRRLLVGISEQVRGIRPPQLAKAKQAGRRPHHEREGEDLEGTRRAHLDREL